MGINSDTNYDSPSLKSEETKTPRISGWRPAYLRRRVLFPFMICFCAMVAALEAIYQVSSAHSGIASSTESRHYTWTYGPTGILTIVAVFWSRVEFQAKQNAPWYSMLGGPQVPQSSVLLDYTSEMQPVSLYTAVKNKHPLVAAGVACSMLLQLLIIFSTSLFSLQQVQILRRDIPVQVQGSIYSLNSSILETVKAQPFDIINGILFANVSYPAGTTRDLSFQTFSVSNFSSDATVTTDVSGLSADLDCEPAHITINLWQERISMSGDVFLNRHVVEQNEIYSPSCKMSNVSINMPQDPGTGSSGMYQVSGSFPPPQPKPHYAARFLSRRCEGMSGPDANRIVLVLAEGQYGEEEWGPMKAYNSHGIHWNALPGATTETRNITLKRSVQMICKPTYSLLEMQAKANTTDASLTANLATMTTEQSVLPSLTAWDIANNILTAPSSWGPQEPIEYHNPFFTNKPYDNKWTDYWSPSYTYDSVISADYPLRVGAWLANATGSIDNLFQTGVLHSAASSYYRATAAQLVQKGLDAQQHRLLRNASAVVAENRVVMNLMPLRAIEVCLTVAVLLAGAMIMLVSRDVLAPWNPNYISAIAMVMANSKTFCESLRETSAAPLKVLAGRLGGRRYYSDHTAEGLSITTVDDRLHDMNRKDSSISDGTVKSRKWKPLPNLLLRILFFIVVALVIGALEVLLHLSQANEGIGDASSSQTMHYLWTMLPAAILQGIGLVFSSIDFNTRCLAPYAHLQRRNYTTFRPFMTVNFLDSLDATLIFDSIRLKHYAVLATTLATLISPFLTIITSSLYSVIDVPRHMNVSLTEETTFFGAKSGNSSDGGILIANYILRDNLSTPRWTYDELAFPKLATDGPPRDNLIDHSFVDIRVPAMRATMNCHFQTAADLRPKITEKGTLKVSVPRGQCSANGTNLALNAPLNGSIAASNTAVFGKAFGPVRITWMKGFSDVPDNSSLGHGAVPPLNNTQIDWGLPYGGDSISYIWGSLGNGSIDHIAGVVCCKYAEMVDTQTRFQLPTFNIVNDHPPLPDESSTRPAKNYTEPQDWAGLDAQEGNLDSFFQALVYGKYAIPAGTLGSPEKNEEVIQAITRQHKLFKAQLFNSYNRVAVNGTAHASSLRGNVTTAGHLRVFQDAVATRVLEGLLAAMLVFGIVGSVILNTDRVLPKNPCSIAAVASLLVDSDLLGRYEGYVGNPNHQAVGQTLFANCRFFSEWNRQGSLDEPSKDKFIVRLVDYTKDDPPEGWI